MRIYDYSCTYGDEQNPSVTMKLYDVDNANMARIRNLAAKGEEIKIEIDSSWDDWILPLTHPDILRSYAKEDAEMAVKMYGMSKIEFTPRDIKVEKVIFNKPATIVFWSDGTKTVVKCGENDMYDKEKGFFIACAKKLFGNDYKAIGRMNKALEMAIVQTKEDKND